MATPNPKTQPAKVISIFNHKGGVSKTTTAFNLGWMLAKKGKRVMLVDADPQCNLTGMILGYNKTQLETFYKKGKVNNLRDGLSPAFESKPYMIEAVDCVPVPQCPGLFLLPGHINLTEYEITLGIAQQLSGSIVTVRNLPGAAHYLFQKTAAAYQCDYVIIDMSPSVSAMNQNFLITSDYFMVPFAPDYFSLMAVDSLKSILPRWYYWSAQAKNIQSFKDALYPYPNKTPKFLGTIIQNFRLRSGGASSGFKEWIDDINKAVSSELMPVLKNEGMALSDALYKKAGIDENYCLALVSDFNSLIARSQKNQVPVFALKSSQLASGGFALAKQEQNVLVFEKLFSDMANKILILTQDK
jgi:cellulose biosynthesis protein BcsQ